MERKLTAILHADVAGYSRLMREDEEATLRTLTVYREELVTILRQHRGRLVGTAGDGFLAEFASVVDAVQCAVVIQATLKAENASLPANRKMQFRIGINLGDVMVDGEQIYGDGVNIAARLEGLAEPGGICISGTVHEHIKNKLALRYEDLGAQQVKNIAEPVRVYRVMLEGDHDKEEGSHSEPKSFDPSTLLRTGFAQDKLRGGEESRYQNKQERDSSAFGLRMTERQNQPRGMSAARLSRTAVVVGLILLLGGIGTIWYLSAPSIRIPQSEIRTQAEPALPLPDKPSIVVLPFVNISKDPEQDYFSDGLTEVLTGDLTRVSGLFVIARNSAFTYKGKAVKVQDVGREMGVRYVVEGSVLKFGDQLRISAQLIDATTGYHLWSERYDRPLTDIFTLQDEITQKIMTALKVKLTREEQERFRQAPTDSLEAYDYYLRGLDYGGRSTKETNLQARQMFERAVELDPRYAAAYALLGLTHLRDWSSQWSSDPQSLEQAFALAQRAVALDDSLPLAHLISGYVYLWKKQYKQALAGGFRARALDPNNPDIAVGLAEILIPTGTRGEALGLVERAMRLNPRYPDWYL